MTCQKLWTRNFIALIAANGFLFASFHFLLPTITVYAASLGATGAQIGLIGGIFGYSAIFIRLFTDTGVRAFGKKKCLYAGLLLCVASVLGYMLFPSADAIIFARVIHGLGFGLSTTFAAAIAADVIPAARRGEGIGYFGMGSTVAMALAPAFGLYLLAESAIWLFTASIAVSLLALMMAYACKTKEAVTELPPTPPLRARHGGAVAFDYSLWCRLWQCEHLYRHAGSGEICGKCGAVLRNWHLVRLYLPSLWRTAAG